jgi:hypothetical protein
MLRTMRWDRLAPVRTALLTVLGFGSLCLAAFLLNVVAGFVAVGIALLLIEALTGDHPGIPGRGQ